MQPQHDKLPPDHSGEAPAKPIMRKKTPSTHGKKPSSAKPELLAAAQPSSELPAETKANKDLRVALAMKAGHRAKRITQAVKDGATNLNVADARGRTALHWAVSIGDLEAVRLILERSGEVDAQTEKPHETPLHYSVKGDMIEIANMLLDYGASVEAKHVDAPIPLHLAAIYGASKIISALIDKGADVKAKDPVENTVLHCAMCNDEVEIVRMLVAQGADAEACNDEKETPLHMAAYLNAVQCTQFLLSLGVHHSHCNVNGETPVLIAKQFGSSDVLKVLTRAGAK